ncbi:DUF805 domain-containing protein [Agrobacterium tumefaciens]|uniref:DUF805 domain-containing protein n=1 Tax=Agrobacterium tumefaciens TaxID=358 RepID=UPI0039A756BC
MSAYLDAMRRYATFSGRSTREEFWYYHLVLLGLTIGGLIIDVAIAGPREPQPLVSALIVMGHYVPSLAVIVRRLHDLGKSGWLVLTCLIPLVGIVAFIVIGSTPSEHGATFPGAAISALPRLRPLLAQINRLIASKNSRHCALQVRSPTRILKP